MSRSTCPVHSISWPVDATSALGADVRNGTATALLIPMNSPSNRFRSLLSDSMLKLLSGSVDVHSKGIAIWTRTSRRSLIENFHVISSVGITNLCCSIGEG